MRGLFAGITILAEKNNKTKWNVQVYLKKTDRINFFKIPLNACLWAAEIIRRESVQYNAGRARKNPAELAERTQNFRKNIYLKMALASSEWLCHVEAIDIALDTLGKQQNALQFIPMIGPGEASFLSPSINKKDSVLSSVISKSTRVLFMYTGFRCNSEPRIIVVLHYNKEFH